MRTLSKMVLFLILIVFFTNNSYASIWLRSPSNNIFTRNTHPTFRFDYDSTDIEDWSLVEAASRSLIGSYGEFFIENLTMHSGPLDYGIKSYRSSYPLQNGKHFWHAQLYDYDAMIFQNSSIRMVNIDTYKPRTKSLYSRIVKKGKYCTLCWRVKDPYTGNKAKVTIRIKKNSSTRQTIRLGLTRINTNRVYRYKAVLPKGTYKYCIYSTDRAGNPQYNVSFKYITIK